METDNHPQATTETRVIKRYSNRKLYDTRDSRYVTLQQIGEMVRRGEDVQIIDNKSKEDKTEATLALIISEDLKSKSRSVPLGTLRTLIQERGERLLSQLRDGPIGRLIPKSGEHEDDENSTPARGEPKIRVEATPATVVEVGEVPPRSPVKGRLNEFVDASRNTLDQLQATLDERVRAVVPGVLLIRELQDKVDRLTRRVDALEAKVGDRSPSVSDGARSVMSSNYEADESKRG